jgi:hypothetical protein
VVRVRRNGDRLGDGEGEGLGTGAAPPACVRIQASKRRELAWVRGRGRCGVRVGVGVGVWSWVRGRACGGVGVAAWVDVHTFSRMYVDKVASWARYAESRESMDESIEVIDEVVRLKRRRATRMEKVVTTTSSPVDGSTSYGICVVIMPAPHRKACK